MKFVKLSVSCFVSFVLIFLTLFTGCSHNSDETIAPVSPIPAESTAEFDRLCAEAKKQFESEDYTNLSSPMEYKLLWLACEQVTYEDLDLRICKLGKELINECKLNFEAVVERSTNNNVDVVIDLFFISDPIELTLENSSDNADEHFFYISANSMNNKIQEYVSKTYYDSVITFTQNGGVENIDRNYESEYYCNPYIITGLCESSYMENYGYSMVCIDDPAIDFFPLEDYSVPSLEPTAIAIHEWLHQIETIGQMLGIEFPATHSYLGSEEYPGYSCYNSGEANYDYFEFYEQVLSGTVPYTDENGNIRNVGMFPKMWPLLKRSNFTLGDFTISENGSYLSTDDDHIVNLSDAPEIWNLRYYGNNRFAASSAKYLFENLDFSYIDTIYTTVSAFTFDVSPHLFSLEYKDDGTFAISTVQRKVSYSPEYDTVPDEDEEPICYYFTANDGILTLLSADSITEYSSFVFVPMQNNLL